METRTDHNGIKTQEIIEGFLNSYRQLDANATRIFEMSIQIEAITSLLIQKGIIGKDELEEQKKIVEQIIKENFKEAGIGVKIQQSEVDKYKLAEEIEIDCENRIQLCKAACCRLRYSLSIQDIYEGIRWNLGNPFMNATLDDGYCINLERKECKCNIYNNRPLICRTYDCRKDTRIWSDFDKMILNPELLKLQSEEG